MAPFELPDAISGNTYRLGERTLGKVVLVNYWATWCPPCRAEQPALSRIATAYRARGLEVVGVSLDTDDPPAAVRRYGAEYRVPYPLVLGAEDAALTFSMRAVPVTILLDRRGRIAKVITGSVDEPTLIADVEALLREHEGVSP